METYPRHRCPECRNFFRAEIKFPAVARGLEFDPTQLTCPRCGFHFYRFPVPGQNPKPERANPR